MKTNAKILIVDDDMDVINVMQTILEHEGYEVISAMGKNEALQLAREEKPDLAILDVMMTTQYEGFELAKELTENQEFNGMPVIMQTSIEVLTTTNQSVQMMAREMRQDPRYKELQVLLIKDILSATSGIDYRAEDGTSVWLNIGGFVSKPVNSRNLLPELERILSHKVSHS